MPFCLLGIGKQSKNGFLILKRTVPGAPEDKASLDLLREVGFKAPTSDLLPALPSGMAENEKRALINVAAKFLRDWF